MQTVFITGASRGIGLEFVKQFLSLKNIKVFASCRDPSNATELQHLPENCLPHLKLVRLDVTHPNEIEEAVRFLSQDDSIQKNGLNMLINNAGVAFKKQYLGNLTKEGISQQIDVNVVGAMLVTQAFLPLMRQAAAHTPKTKGPLPFRAAVINISSVLGSITENQCGGLYPYRISKAALNMFTKGAAVDLEKDQILSLALHPGWVQTEIGGPKAPLTANESVNGMMGVIQRLTKDNSGGVYDYEGKSIPW